MEQYVYFFGEGRAEGNELGKKFLGGKGANLNEMARLGIPVPPGITITTTACIEYQKLKGFPDGMMDQVHDKMKLVYETTGKVLGDAENPLLVSVRSGAPVSMPGMMDTVLNLGMNENTIQGMIKLTNNERFVWDSYRRFINMFSNVVLGLKHEKFEEILHAAKEKKGVEFDTQLDAADLKQLAADYKAMVKNELGEDFPDDVNVQLVKSIEAVFASWNNERAIVYRQLNNIPHDLGTAVNVQSMVFGNMGDDSGTGVAFTRNPSTGENKFYGEYLMNAQGEDVVAGIRTPQPIAHLEQTNSAIYKELFDVQERLEKHFGDMQDIEFTIQQGKLYLLQTRNGKRTGFAALKIAVDMVNEGKSDKKKALMSVSPESIPSLTAPIFNTEEKKQAIQDGRVLTRGLNAGPGAATGKVVFSAEHAVEMVRKNKKEEVLLVRVETSPEDIAGMDAATGILTARGGMTSHAAVVARGMNKPCVVGCSALHVKEENGKSVATIKKEDGSMITINEYDQLSIDGTTGEVILGYMNTNPSEIWQVLHGDLPSDQSIIARDFQTFMSWAEEVKTLKVRANADTPVDARAARLFGAQGIGLCRTEHMFFAKERITAMQEMIVANTIEEREIALAKLLPFQREDFVGLFEAMEGFPVTIRLLDPPLHEFLPHDHDQIRELASALGIDFERLKNRVEELSESNPMLGHRGCRLGITYPEITRMQARAIFEAAATVNAKGMHIEPEVMVPLVGNVKELKLQREIIDEVAKKVMSEKNVEIKYMVGTMIEVPRAAITADQVASEAEFFSFGTNDLTQTTLAFSRDDADRFLREYINKEIYDRNPFASVDEDGVGEMIRIARDKGRETRPEIKLGVCGEHGGDPTSIDLFHRLGLNYVSASPFRVAVARLSAAQATLRHS